MRLLLFNELEGHEEMKEVEGVKLKMKLNRIDVQIKISRVVGRGISSIILLFLEVC